MTQVIPPATLYSIHPYDQYTTEQNNLWKQLFVILDQIYLRSGGNVDDTDILLSQTESNDTSISQIFSLLAQLKQNLSDIQLNYVEVSGSYTNKKSEFLRVTTESTITLRATPKDGEVVVVQPDGNFLVTISGQINGISSLSMRGAYDAAKLKYFRALGEWVIQ